MKNHKNVISQELQKLEQSDLEAKIGTPESTLTASQLNGWNFKF